MPGYSRLWNDRRPIGINLDELLLSGFSFFTQQAAMLIQDEISDLNRARSRNSRYEIRDLYLRFHFEFLYPNSDLIQQQRQSRLRRLIDERFTAYVGKTAYEELARLRIQSLGDAGQLPFVPESIGRAWTRHTERNVAAVSWRKQCVLVGECKWTTTKMNATHSESLRERAARFQAFKPLKMHCALFSKSGLTWDREALAAGSEASLRFSFLILRGLRVSFHAMKRTIGVVMDFFRPGVVEGAGAFARTQELRIDARWSVRADWMPDRPEWDGVITHFVDTPRRAGSGRVEALGVPEVSLNPDTRNGAVVSVDYAVCGELALGEFVRCGLRTVCCGMGSGQQMMELSAGGFERAARLAGLDCRRLPPWSRDSSLDEVVLRIAGFLAGQPRPCGLFLQHAGVAFSLVDELARRGMRVPEEVALVVIDKDVQRTAELAPVPLTGVVLDDWQLGYEAAQVLQAMLDGKEPAPGTRWIRPQGIHRRASTWAKVVRDPVVLKAQHLIAGPQGTLLTITDLAAGVAVARRSLELRFRRETGITLHEALTRRRIDAAKRLLSSTNETMTMVAETCGYSSVHYFTTAFKRATGTTPGAWRASHRAAHPS